MFDIYELVYYYTPVADFPFEKKCIGRYLGVAENSTDDLAFIVLPESGRPVTRKDVWAIPEDDRRNPAIIEQICESRPIHQAEAW